MSTGISPYRALEAFNQVFDNYLHRLGEKPTSAARKRLLAEFDAQRDRLIAALRDEGARIE